MPVDAISVWSHSGAELKQDCVTLALIPSAEACSILDYGCGQGEWAGEPSRTSPEVEARDIDTRTCVA